MSAEGFEHFERDFADDVAWVPAGTYRVRRVAPAVVEIIGGRFDGLHVTTFPRDEPDVDTMTVSPPGMLVVPAPPECCASCGQPIERWHFRLVVIEHRVASVHHADCHPRGRVRRLRVEWRDDDA